MSFSITPEWVAGLRRDVRKWDVRVEEGQQKEKCAYSLGCKWTWRELTPPLKYTGSLAEQVSLQRDAVVRDLPYAASEY